MLDEYVPFYFDTRSPMMLTYQRGNVTGERENLDELIYLVSTAEAIAEAGLPFVFSDGHPVKEPRAFFDKLQHLDEVDLALMTSTRWYDTDADPDRKRRRQAEFLIHVELPWYLVQVLGVRTDSMKDWVEQQTADAAHRPRCLVRPGWYYQ